jgi:uncharacterized protein
MTERDDYPTGVPCWVETLQADPKAAMDFYASVFGWEFEGPAPIADDTPGDYYVARLRGRDVAGIGRLAPSGTPRAPHWTTYVRVDDVSKTAAEALNADGNVLVEPLDAPPAGSLAILADPAGAAIGIWEPQERQGAQLVNEASAWALSSLRTNDFDGAKAFYGTLFGWQAEPFGNFGMEVFRRPGYFGGQPLQPVPRDVVAGMIPMDEGDTRPHWELDFWIDGVDAGAERATARGGTVIVAPFDMGDFRTAVLADPEGASFSISQLMIER